MNSTEFGQTLVNMLNGVSVSGKDVDDFMKFRQMAFDLANGVTVITPAAQPTVSKGGRE